MRFGNCTTDPSLLNVMRQYSYSFAEADFQSIGGMSDDKYDDLSQAVKSTGITIAGLNCFASAEVRFLTWSDHEAATYFEQGVRRAKPFGLEYVVIGSGKARSIPDGMSREEGLSRLTELLRLFGDIAERYDIEVYLEPLRHFETDVINTVKEAAELCKRVGHPRVGCMADFYHMAMVEEPFLDIVETEGYLRHIHIATAPERTIPVAADAAQVESMVSVLKSCHYRGRIVLEGGGKPDMDTALREFSCYFPKFQ